MKIVYICNEINLNSGWGVVNHHTIVNSLPFFDEVFVFTLKAGNNNNLSKYANLKIFPILGSMSDSFFKIIFIEFDKNKIKAKIDISDIDVVHILVEPLLPLIGVFQNSKKVFSIVGTYSDFPFRGGINKSLYRTSLRKVDVIVSISEYTANRFNNVFKQTIKVIPLGVDFKRFNCSRTSGKRKKSFIFVGHIKPRKGLIYALKAFKNIMKNDNDVAFYVIGERSAGKYADTCFKYIKDNKMDKQVIFLGKVGNKELSDTYSKSICNILPSVNDGDYFEGFGLIHLEANASGIPSIGSLGCGNESAIVDGKTGFLCKQKNIKSIQKSMEIILKDYENDDFHIWEKECISFAELNDWKIYFKQLKKEIY